MREFKTTREMVDQFAKTHPRLDELGKVIEIGVQAGLGLQEAYAIAVALDETRNQEVSHAEQDTEASPYDARRGSRQGLCQEDGYSAEGRA
jgi:hypothetical protein